VHKKVRGLTQALEAIRDMVVEKTDPGSTVYVSLSHGLNEPVCLQLRGLIEAISDRRIEIRLTTTVGAVIGTYAGPGAVALCCIQE
jgi:fatty acid-binding protein DegV